MSAVVRRSAAFIVAAVLLLGGCGGSTTNEPTTTSGDASGGAGGVAGSEGGTDDAGSEEVAPPNDLSGTWVGYVENFEFNDHSNVVTLALTSAPLGGHATFGQSPPPPPPTDPNVGYPPGVEFAVMGIRPSGPYAGFSFTLMKASLDGQRLQFDITPAEVWKAWCELQTPILDEVNAGGNYNCVHNWGFSFGSQGCAQMDPKAQQQVPIDCGKLALCGIGTGVCSCTAQGCTVNPDMGLHFDLVVALPKADGSAAGLDSSVHNVHLTKR